MSGSESNMFSPGQADAVRLLGTQQKENVAWCANTRSRWPASQEVFSHLCQGTVQCRNPCRTGGLPTSHQHTLRKSAHMNTAPRGHMERRERNQKQGEEEEAESAQTWARTSSPPQRKHKRLEENQNTKILLLFFFFNFYDVVLVSATQQSNQPKLYIPLPPSRWWWDRLRPSCLLFSVPGRTQRNNEGPEITSWHKLWTRFKNPTATRELPGAKAGYLTWALHPAPSRGVLVRAIWFLI